MAHGQASFPRLAVAAHPAAHGSATFSLAAVEPVGASGGGNGGAACALEGPRRALRECAGLCPGPPACQPAGPGGPQRGVSAETAAALPVLAGRFTELAPHL